MKDPLVLCIDTAYVQEPIRTPDAILNDFLNTLDQTGGLSDVQIQYLPPHGVDRESKLDRLRIEIMAGEGPDVFIMKCDGALTQNEIGRTAYETALIMYPEQAMANGLFLPMDEYMEHNTRFTEWDKLTQPVLEAGRNEEGQQIFPLTYTLPVICYSQNDVDLDLTGAAYTWDDMWTDPQLSPYASHLACFADLYMLEDGTKKSFKPQGSGLEFSFGALADYETETLLFTEEELLARVQTAVDHIAAELDKPDMDEPAGYITLLGESLDYDFHKHVPVGDPLTVIPMYSDDGGVAASVTSWAAVNRNTNRPEDAFTVIDMLLSARLQENFAIYGDMLIHYSHDIPMHEDMLHPDHPVQSRGIVYTEQVYNELCEVRSQIAQVNFHNELSRELDNLFELCLFGSTGRYSDFVPTDGFVSVEQSVHESYEKMQRMVRE